MLRRDWLKVVRGVIKTQSMPSRDVNTATRLAEASWRRDIFMRKMRIVKYWLKLQHTNNCILKSSWNFLFNELLKTWFLVFIIYWLKLDLVVCFTIMEPLNVSMY